MDIKSLKAGLVQFLNENSLNIVSELDNIPIYEEPLIGLASAYDPLFIKLKDSSGIGEHHLTPVEWLPEAKTVISYFLPFSEAIRKSNSITKDFPSEGWLSGRIQGETLNNSVRQYLIESFDRMGEKAIAPVLDPRFKVVNRLSSNWSERHAAYIAGLGTFNLSKSFITEKGCAGRFGSVIVTAEYQPTPRNYEDIYGLCNDCGVCIDRCPVNAITSAGKDHDICADFLDNVIKPRYAPRYGCGKCQTAVPCEAGIPK